MLQIKTTLQIVMKFKTEVYPDIMNVVKIKVARGHQKSPNVAWFLKNAVGGGSNGYLCFQNCYKIVDSGFRWKDWPGWGQYMPLLRLKVLLRIFVNSSEWSRMFLNQNREGEDDLLLVHSILVIVNPGNAG